MPVADDGRQLCLSWHLIGKCNTGCKSHFDSVSGVVRSDSLHIPASIVETRQLLAWQKNYCVPHNSFLPQQQQNYATYAPGPPLDWNQGYATHLYAPYNQIPYTPFPQSQIHNQGRGTYPPQPSCAARYTGRGGRGQGGRGQGASQLPPTPPAPPIANQPHPLPPAPALPPGGG